ncbi:hypothetical protein ACQKII_09395 [Lysinibacillus sp. NPDC048646]|uniref:hypothetical protein n=1 Tax=Lysinibacillus sp. NPDC048646 TaxID=3390574 RepID=UPI003D090E12
MTLQEPTNKKRDVLKQTLEEFLSLDDIQLAIVSGVIAGMKMERKIKDDNNKVS